MKNFVFLFLATCCLYSCKKEEGEGGTSSIIGQVKTFELSHFDVPGGNQSVDTLTHYFDADKEVYIVYGQDDNLYDDSYNTSWDGSFEFKNLRKGNYTIFVYSDCEADTTGLANIAQSNPIYAQELATTIWHPNCSNGEFPQIFEIEITNHNTVYDLGTLSIFKLANN